MSLHTAKLASLIASRICHDLISPVGAISNGLELMGLANIGGVDAEMALISESCANANARIRFFRIAFGMATEVARVSRRECRDILTGMYDGSRISLDWLPLDDLPRREVQMAFLALQCAETSIPYGGQITIDHQPGKWSVTAQGERLDRRGEHWDDLEHLSRRGAAQGDLHISPAQVQFALLPFLARDMGRRPVCNWGDQHLTLTV